MYADLACCSSWGLQFWVIYGCFAQAQPTSIVESRDGEQQASTRLSIMQFTRLSLSRRASSVWRRLRPKRLRLIAIALAD
jgi:hypothetical protein